MKSLWKNVIDMPPVWLLIFMVAVWAQARVYNPGRIDSPIVSAIGWFCIVAGVVTTALAVGEFRRNRTTVIPRNVPDAMITGGVFRVSRNPIYLADALVLFGVALLQHSLIAVVIVPVFMVLIEQRFIKGEEAALQAKYGAAYAEYCARTRRWL